MTDADANDPAARVEPLPMTNDPGIELTLRFVRIAHQYGLPAYELESLSKQVAAAFDFRLRVITSPTFLDITVDDASGAGQVRLLLELEEVSYNLQKLTQTMVLAERVAAHQVDVDQAERRLDEIEALRPPYPASAVGVAYAACGGGFAVLLSASWGDVALASGLSILVFLLLQAAPRSTWLASRVYVIASLTAAVLASTAGVVVGKSDTDVVALCAFVVLIPGLGLTLGAFELASGHTVLGWHRFIRASVQTFALFAGASLGSTAVQALIGDAGSPDRPDVNAIMRYLFLVVLMIGLAVVFQVMPLQAPWAVAAGVLAYGGLDLGGHAGNWQGPFLGALTLGLFAAVFVRIRSRANPLTVVLPGIMILVPGVAAYSSLRALDATSPTATGSSAQGVFVQILAILAGLFVAGSLVAVRSDHGQPSHTADAAGS